MTDPNPEDITFHLKRLEQGDRSAVAHILPYIYDDLRALAEGMFRGAANQTLQPTALVHEAYMRLVKKTGGAWEGRQHFFDVAAMAMRQLLTDHVRRRKAEKRGGKRDRVILDENIAADANPKEGIDLVALDSALQELEKLDPRQARIVELRFLAGLSIEETAEVLGIGSRTVRRDWQMARGWLHRAIDEKKSEL